MKKLFALVLTLSFAATLVSCASAPPPAPPKAHALVMMTDFGLKDGAVSAMKGVAYGVSDKLLISDLTHEIPAYNIWEASYRLKQTANYWPSGTVFVNVIDPGVGSARKSVVARTKSGNMFVGPDNGYLTLITELDPAIEVRVIDEKRNRLKGSEESYTFHGRDLYSYVGALLASGKLKYEDVGPVSDTEIVRIPYQTAKFETKGQIVKVLGGIPILDPQYGNVWTNIAKKEFVQNFDQSKPMDVVVRNKNKVVFRGKLNVVSTFASVPEGKPLLYFNSLLDLSLALNMDNFALKNKVASGPDWTVEVSGTALKK